jgi:hypothetical protein
LTAEGDYLLVSEGDTFLRAHHFERAGVWLLTEDVEFLFLTSHHVRQVTHLPGVRILRKRVRAPGSRDPDERRIVVVAGTLTLNQFLGKVVLPFFKLLLSVGYGGQSFSELSIPGSEAVGFVRVRNQTLLPLIRQDVSHEQFVLEVLYLIKSIDSVGYESQDEQSRVHDDNS